MGKPRRKTTSESGVARRPKAVPGSARGSASAPRERLRLRDVRRAFRLIGEVRALGAQPQRWRPHMVKRLRKLLCADMVVSSEICFLAPAHARPASTADRALLKGAQLRDRGFGIGQDGQSWHIDEQHPELRPQDYHVMLAPRIAPDGRVAVRPRQNLRAGRYFILSQVSLPHADTVDQLAAYRFDTAQPFGAREAKLLRLVHMELGRFWRAKAMRQARDPRADLAPRLSQTLTLLLAGAAEKQVARELGISPHTVHNYVKALHQRFSVTSRGELLARFSSAAGAGDFRPKLSVELPPGPSQPRT